MAGDIKWKDLSTVYSSWLQSSIRDEASPHDCFTDRCLAREVRCLQDSLEEPFETLRESSEKLRYPLRHPLRHSHEAQTARAGALAALEDKPCKASSNFPWSLLSGEDPEEERREDVDVQRGEAQDAEEKVEVPRVKLKAIISMNAIAESTAAKLSSGDVQHSESQAVGFAEYDEQLQEELYCKGELLEADKGQARSQASSARSANAYTDELLKALVSLPTAYSKEKGEIEENFKTPPVKHTFIHYDDPTSLSRQPTPTTLTRCSSAPSIMMSRPFALVKPSMETIHLRGDCDPCAFYQRKEDGCRWGSECRFCHFCPPGEMKNRKKEKRRARKMLSWSLASSNSASWQYSSGSQMLNPMVVDSTCNRSGAPSSDTVDQSADPSQAGTKDFKEDVAGARDMLSEISRGAASSNMAVPLVAKSSSSAAAAFSVTAGPRNVHYKTAICKYFSWNRCKNGSSCPFSHGVEELRSPPRQRQVAKKVS